MIIEHTIQTLVEKAASAAGFSLDPSVKWDVTPPKQKGHGDFAANPAMILASRLKQNPRQIAQTLVDHMDFDPAIIEKVEIAGPGFINFTLSSEYYISELREVLKKKETYGRFNAGREKRTQVEFVSANPTGPLTIGHGRQAVLGDTVARLLEAAGYDVHREYYFNDAGRQMRVLGDSVRLRYRELLGEAIEFPEDYYQGEYIRDIAQKARDEKGDDFGDEANLDYFKTLAEQEIFAEIQKTLGRMRIRFDEFFNEKSLYDSGKIESLLSTFREKGLAYDKDGAVWLKLSEMGQQDDRVIVKSTGEPTYRLPDMAYHRDKLDRGFDLVVDLFGADHGATYPDVLAGVTALGYDVSKIRVLIHQFVTLVEGKEKVKMSTRKANFVTLDELMDEVGEDVTRYFFLNRSMSSHLNFDLTLAKTESDENPVYYVQYAHARICSILRRGESEGVDMEADADLSQLTAPEEMDLIRQVIQYPRFVRGAAESFEPHRIPNYLEETATLYHRFQHAGRVDEKMRVLSDNPEMTRARLALCKAVKIVIANGLELLGISAPEKM